MVKQKEQGKSAKCLQANWLCFGELKIFICEGDLIIQQNGIFL